MSSKVEMFRTPNRNIGQSNVPVNLNRKNKFILQETMISKSAIDYEKLRNAIGDLVVSEISYNEDLSLIQEVYKDLLSSNTSYVHLFNEEEKKVLFQDICNLQARSQKLVELIKCHLRLKAVDKTPNPFDLIASSNLEKLNLGSILVSELCENSRYMELMHSFVSTQSLRFTIIERKLNNGDKRARNWLQEGIKLCEDKVNQHRHGKVGLEELLKKPLQRISKYPILLKAIIDANCPWSPLQRHELNICLIRMNQLLYVLLNCQPIDDCIPQGRTREEYNSRSVISSSFLSLGNLEEISDAISRFNIVSQVVFDLELKVCTLRNSILHFSAESYMFAKSWNEVLGAYFYSNSLYVTPYESFVAKCAFQKQLTTKFVGEEFDGKVVQRLQIACDICKKAKMRIQDYLKAKGKYTSYLRKKSSGDKSCTLAQSFSTLYIQLEKQLPTLSQLLERLCVLAHREILCSYIKWMEIYKARQLDHSVCGVDEITEHYQILSDSDQRSS